MEVPPVETNATGLAEFRPILNENTITYTLNVTDIDNVTAAHIHSGKHDQNGPIIVTLFKSNTPTPKMVSGLLSEGDITASDLKGTDCWQTTFRSPKFYAFYGCICKHSYNSISEWGNPWTNIKCDEWYDDEMI